MKPNDDNEIFQDALELQEGSERERYLRNACAEDQALRARVDALLDDHASACVMFEKTEAALMLPNHAVNLFGLHLGEMIGPYKIEKILGEGGSGIVYEAEQLTPVRRKVALKILKLGMDTRRVIARFEAERQVLAMLEHPNIAHVYDAGATEAGRPYFVMELVGGLRITEYCQRNNVPLPDRLRLMLQVFAAVQHAHQKGIIHRDLKPSNLLVSVIDGLPIPKVIDFGIAKAMAGQLVDEPDYTAAFQFLGTPAYMSPEQLAGSAADIDTRSDIYSLGIVLYELIAGRTPFANTDSTGSEFITLRRRVLEETPPRPSIIEALTLPATKTWRNRLLSSRTQNDLDWITLKALEKESDRRYQTVRELGRDIERYLENKPINARPPSQWYRFKKTVQRNVLASTAIGVAIAALVGGFTTSTMLYLKAVSAERKQTLLRAEAEEREHVTKAAIFLMQNQPAEADAEVERLGGFLTQPSLEATNVFRSLAIWSALQGHWKKSALRLLSLSKVNRFDAADQTDNATRELLPIAPTLVESGEFDLYQEFRRNLVKRLGTTQNPIAAEHLLKVALQIPIAPSSVNTLTPVALVAEKSLEPERPPRDRIEAWRCAVLGLWHYRTGRFAEASAWCDRSLLFKDAEQTRQQYARLVRAMALRKTGRQDEAHSEIENADSVITDYFSRPLEYERNGVWHDWLGARLLLREAKQLLKTGSKK